MGLSCSWKQLFAVGSTTEVKLKSFKQRSSCKAPTLGRSRNGRHCDDSMHNWVYCCHVTTFWNLIGTANFRQRK